MPGIHHVTAITPVIQSEIWAFTLTSSGYGWSKRRSTLMTLSAYHFYFGGETGRPGTILTFFPWVNATEGQRGVGETSQTAFRVPLRSIGYWTERFTEKGISHGTPEKLFGETVVPFTDQDGTALALVGVADAENEPGLGNQDIPSEHAIRGLQGVTRFSGARRRRPRS